jgi:uncharacterized protein involved in type VI secretion and phage assembly
MINGVVVGIVVDNKDPEKMHRIKVKYPVDSGEEVTSSWCRMASPMTGNGRGLVILPDIGTEVVLGFAYRSLSPYVLGAVYNGAEDPPEPYHNDDNNDDKRVFWSRNDHMVIFDDTSGAEKVEIGAQASGRLDVKSAPIYQSLNSAEKVITVYCEKDTAVESVETISIKCKDFKLEADMTVEHKASQTAVYASGTSTDIKSGTTQEYKASMVKVNPGSPPPDPKPVLATPAHRHPPKT